jgi:hypothetical protein
LAGKGQAGNQQEEYKEFFHDLTIRGRQVAGLISG